MRRDSMDHIDLWGPVLMRGSATAPGSSGPVPHPGYVFFKRLPRSSSWRDAGEGNISGQGRDGEERNGD